MSLQTWWRSVNLFRNAEDLIGYNLSEVLLLNWWNRPLKYAAVSFCSFLPMLPIGKLVIGDFTQREKTFFSISNHGFTWQDFPSFLSDHHYNADSNIVE